MISFKNVIVFAALFGFLAIGMTGCELMHMEDALNEDGQVFDEDFSFADGECFEFVYPVQVEFKGEQISVASAEELDQLCEQETEEDEIRFVYPLQILREGATTPETLENDEQLDEVFFDCFPNDCPIDDEEEPQNS